MSADEAVREAKQTRQLIHEGRIDLIKERAIHFKLGKGYLPEDAEIYGERKQLEAYRYILSQWRIWERNFKKLKELLAARRKAAAERAATIAERAGWDAVWAAANPRGLLTPPSHMVCRALVQAMLTYPEEL